MADAAAVASEQKRRARGEGAVIDTDIKIFLIHSSLKPKTRIYKEKLITKELS